MGRGEMGKKRSDVEADALANEQPLKMQVDFGMIRPAEEAAALEASQKSGASLHVLRFADGVTAIVTVPRIGTERASRLSLPSIAKPMLQAYAQVENSLDRHIDALEGRPKRPKAAKKKENR